MQFKTGTDFEIEGTEKLPYVHMPRWNKKDLLAVNPALGKVSKSFSNLLNYGYSVRKIKEVLNTKDHFSMITREVYWDVDIVLENDRSFCEV